MTIKKSYVIENEFELYEMCTLNNSESVFDLLALYFSNEENIKNKILFNQAKTVANDFNLSLEHDAIVKFCNALSVLQTANAMSQYITKVDSHNNIRSEPVDFVMFGDSITDWGPWYELFPKKKLVNRGIAGDNTQGMLYRMGNILPLNPKKVFIMAGINDLYQGFSIKSILKRYCKMLDFFQMNNIEPIVQSTLFVGKRLAALNPLVLEFNQNLQDICKDKKISYIDLTIVLSPNNTLPSEHSRDNLHLTAIAYQKWAELIRPWLRHD